MINSIGIIILVCFIWGITLDKFTLTQMLVLSSLFTLVTLLYYLGSLIKELSCTTPKKDMSEQEYLTLEDEELKKNDRR